MYVHTIYTLKKIKRLKNTEIYTQNPYVNNHEKLIIYTHRKT